MNSSELITFITNISPWLVVKIGILVFLIFYVFFAAILNRQVTLMNQVLEAKFSPVIKLLAVIHLFVTIFILIIALLFL